MLGIAVGRELGLLVDLRLWLAVTISSLYFISELIRSLPTLPGLGRAAPTSRDLHRSAHYSHLMVIFFHSNTYFLNL